LIRRSQRPLFVSFTGLSFKGFFVHSLFSFFADASSSLRHISYSTRKYSPCLIFTLPNFFRKKNQYLQRLPGTTSGGKRNRCARYTMLAQFARAALDQSHVLEPATHVRSTKNIQQGFSYLLRLSTMAGLAMTMAQGHRRWRWLYGKCPCGNLPWLQRSIQSPQANLGHLLEPALLPSTGSPTLWKVHPPSSFIEGGLQVEAR
jgi:hypothetical protein